MQDNTISIVDEMEDEEETPAPPMPVTYGKTIGQEIAFHSKAVRRKYGRYPVLTVNIFGFEIPIMQPLPGHEDDMIPPFPDTSEQALRRRALNRADDRSRFRFYRFGRYSDMMHKRLINDTKELPETSGDDSSDPVDAGEPS